MTAMETDSMAAGEDPWRRPIRDWLIDRHIRMATTEEIAAGALSLLAPQQDPVVQCRVNAIMAQLGWVQRGRWWQPAGAR